MAEHDKRAERQGSGTRAVLQSAWPVAVVCLGGLAAAFPLLIRPYATHLGDTFVHLLRAFALDQGVSQGDAYPLRFPAFLYGYGAAVLSYYPPLSYYLMEVVHLLGANYIFAYNVAFTCVAVGAALSSYYLGARVFNRVSAVVISLAYVYNPFFLANIYARGALAESVALAVAPFLFASFLRVATETDWRAYLETSLAIALIILAHPLSTFLLAPFLAGYAILMLVRAGSGKRWRVVLLFIASSFTGGLLASFYWLPAQLEPGGRRLIDLPVALGTFMAELKPVGQVFHFGLTTTFRPDSIWPDLSTIAVPVLVVISLIHFALTARRRRGSEKAQFVFFAVSAVVAFLAVTTWARPLWEKLPPVAYLQFPLRWFGPLALFTALVIGGGLDLDLRDRLDKVYRVAVCAILLFVVITSLKNVLVGPSTVLATADAEVTPSDISESGLLAYEYKHADVGSWVWGNEYLPSTSSLSDYLQCQRTVFFDVPVQSGLPAVNAQVVPIAAEPNVLEAVVKAGEPWRLSLHAFWIPGWSATLDGQPAPAEPTDAIGVTGVAVPAGEHRVRLVFGPTPLRRVAIWVSLLALLGWLVIAWRRHWRLAAVVTVLLALTAGLIGGRALAAPGRPVLTPADINLGGKIGLEGYTFARQGEAVDVRLLWLARQSMEESYKVFVHIVNDQGQAVGLLDSRPQHYASNTNRWIPGQVVYDRFEVPLKPGTPAGRYQVRVGLYNEADMQRLAVLDAAGKQVDDQVLLGYQELP